MSDLTALIMKRYSVKGGLCSRATKEGGGDFMRFRINGKTL